MAELDKKSESSGERDDGAEPSVDSEEVTDPPRRRKPDRGRRDKAKRPATKLAPSAGAADGAPARLRSSR